MSYSSDELFAQVERVIARLDRMHKDMVGIEETLEQLLDGRKQPAVVLPAAPCPYLHYPFPPVYQPVPPYITWSMTYPPKPEDGTK